MAKKPETLIRFRVEDDDTQYEIDPLDLTLGEMAGIEREFGMPYNRVLDEWGDSQRFSQMLIAMAIQRDKPNFGLSDAGNLRPDQLEFIEERPTKASSQSGTKK